MANKLNIFSALPTDHSDDEDHGKGNQGKNAKKTTNKTQGGHKDAKPNNQPIKASNEDPKKAHKDDHKKFKQTPESGHHASDRHSGTGHAAFDKKTFKKGGHGKGNVGKADDKEENAKEEEGTEVVEKEEEPKGITLEEYWAKKGIKTETQTVDPNIKKKMEEELTKELLAKKATPLVSKKKADASEPQVKAESSSHLVSLNSAHSDLLNFRTGFVEREYKERTKDGERPAPRERKEYPKKEEKIEEAQEGEKTEKAEEGDESPEDKKGGAPRKQYSKGGYKGNKQGGSKPYNNNSQKGGQPKIDLGDDAFPKLG